MIKTFKLLLILCLLLVFNGCISSNNSNEGNNLPFNMEKSIAIAEDYVNNNSPGYIKQYNLTNKKAKLINEYQIPGLPDQIVKNVWHVSLMPPKEKPGDGIGVHVFIDAFTGKVLDKVAHPLYFSGKNINVKINNNLIIEWRGQFLDGEQLEEVQTTEMLEEFCNSIGTKKKNNISQLNKNKEIILAYPNEKVDEVFLNGNVLILRLSDNPKKVNVITIRYADFPGEVLGVKKTSVSGEFLGQTFFDKNIHPWVFQHQGIK